VSVSFTESSIRLRRRVAPPPPTPRNGHEAGGAGFLRVIRARNGDSTAPFARKPVLSGSSCCWFQAKRIMVRSAPKPNVKVAPRAAAAPIIACLPVRVLPLARRFEFDTSGSNPLCPASQSGPCPGIAGTQRSVDLSGGWRPRARSLARKIAHLAPTAEISGARLCSMNFQYPKVWERKVRDRLRFRGDRFESAIRGNTPWTIRRKKASSWRPQGLRTRANSGCEPACTFSLVPRHSDYDWLILSQSRMGKSSRGTRIWMLLATPG
jgi:hypothetical protein